VPRDAAHRGPYLPGGTSTSGRSSLLRGGGEASPINLTAQVRRAVGMSGTAIEPLSRDIEADVAGRGKVHIREQIGRGKGLVGLVRVLDPAEFGSPSGREPSGRQVGPPDRHPGSKRLDVLGLNRSVRGHARFQRQAHRPRHRSRQPENQQRKRGYPIGQDGQSNSIPPTNGPGYNQILRRHADAWRANSRYSAQHACIQKGRLA